jgi:hypothetical protein
MKDGEILQIFKDAGMDVSSLSDDEVNKLIKGSKNLILKCAEVAKTQERGTQYDWVSGSLFDGLTKSIAIRISSLAIN